MSRFKFRLWNKRENKMISADEATHDYSQVLAIGLHGLPIAVDRDSFKPDGIVGWNVEHYLAPLQWTGFKDKQGREIYEGDIVQEDDYYRPLVIAWDNAGFYRKYANSDGGIAGIEAEECEIIGNIYETPELLKEHVKEGE